jgi:AcrR family transcriptional regulator
MPTTPELVPPSETRQRLLERAGPIFADRGFRRTTVRDICAAAEVNLAAINYHFGDKAGLYGAVLRHGLEVALERHPPDEGVTAESPAEERLFAFVHSFLLRIHGDRDDDWHGRLMAHEMMEPTPALDALVEDLIRPLFKRLCGLVSELISEPSNPERVILCARSIVGQCVFYHHSRPVMLRLSPHEPHGDAQLERLARHIASFSLEGLRHLPSERLPVVVARPTH